MKSGEKHHRKLITFESAQCGEKLMVTGLCFHPLLLTLNIMVVSVIIIIQVIMMVIFLTNEDEEEAGGGPICLFVCFLFVCLFVLTNEDKEEAGGGPESTRNSNSGHEQLSHRLLVVPFKYLYSFIKFTSQQKAREHKNLVCDST